MKGFFVRTVGGCMRPLVKSGDIVYIEKKQKYCLGDVVLYEIKNQKFLHRIVKSLPDKKYIVCDDVGITSPMVIFSYNILGFYPTIFNGIIGYLYHVLIRLIFVFGRKIKNFFKI